MGANSSSGTLKTSKDEFNYKVMDYDDSPERDSNVKFHLKPTAFCGICAKLFSASVSPSPRFAAAYCNLGNKFAIAYGQNSHWKFFNDFWIYDLKSNEWTCFKQNLLSPRAYVGSAVHNDEVFFFGGMSNDEAFSDFHSLNLSTGEIKTIESEGAQPPPCTSPLLVAYSERVLVLSTSLYLYEFANRIWKTITLDNVPPLFSYNCSVVGQNLFTFLDAEKTHFIKTNLHSLTSENLDLSKSEGTPSFQNCNFLSIGEFIFVFSVKKDYSKLFCFNILLSRWFNFYLQPDGATISLEDGHLLYNGTFVLPCFHSYSCWYRGLTRKLYFGFGTDEYNPPCFYEISIGESLSYLHLQSDMMTMLNSNN